MVNWDITFPQTQTALKLLLGFIFRATWLWTGFLITKIIKQAFFFFLKTAFTVAFNVITNTYSLKPELPSLQFKVETGHFFVCFSHWLVTLIACLCHPRWDCSADEPSSCCHRRGSRPLEMCEAGPAPVRARAGALLGYPQEEHPAVQQFCITVCLKLFSSPRVPSHASRNADLLPSPPTLCRATSPPAFCSFLSG